MFNNHAATVTECIYQHVILDGTPYQVGWQQGEFLKRNTHAGQFCTAFYTQSEVQPPTFGYESFAAMRQALEQVCPGLNDEIQGFADSLGVPPERVFHYQAACCALPTPRACSHMAVLPAISSDRHVYMGRSYELNPADEDLRLCTTRVQGKAAHVGFSTLLLGRLDGLNEHGLAVTMSAGSAVSEREPRKGFDFWVALRAVLDNCKTVREAVTWLSAMLLSTYTIFMLADKSGHAALVEAAGGSLAVKQISARTPDQYLIANNHYTLPTMQRHNQNKAMLENSTQRYHTIEAWLKAHAPRLNKMALQGILSKVYPAGCCCPFYAHGLGTLWALVFDVTAGTVDICFGPPTYNDWYRFTPTGGTAGVTEYCVKLPSVKS
jgi:predicted choloylglycine hydrolase